MSDYLNTEFVHVPELTMTREQFMMVYKRYFGEPPVERSELVSETGIMNSKNSNMNEIRKMVQETLRSGISELTGSYPDYKVVMDQKSMEIRRIAKIGNLDISRYDMKELAMGYEVEKEHGTVNLNTNVTNDDEVKTMKIAIAHLNEVPDYYTKLAKFVENKKLEEAKKRRKKANPWAVCIAKVGRENKDKYERCVMGVKKGQGMKEESGSIDEKSVSKKQQRFMGQVHALQTGQMEPKDVNPKFRKAIVRTAETMKKKDTEKFAKTKHKGLPERKKSLNECGCPHSGAGKSRLVVKDSVDNMTPEKISLTKKFILFCLQELEIKHQCSIFLTGKRGGPIKTTASYNPDNNDIWIYVKNRNALVDPLRSIAHELRHMKQNIDGEITDESGRDGSPQENQANEFSGLMIRKFGRMFPEIYE